MIPDETYHNKMLDDWQRVWAICMPPEPGIFEYNWNGMSFDNIELSLKIGRIEGNLPMFFPNITMIPARYDNAFTIYFFLFPKMFRYIQTLFTPNIISSYALSTPWIHLTVEGRNPNDLNFRIADVLGGERNDQDYQTTYQKLYRRKGLRWFSWSCPMPTADDTFVTIQNNEDFGEALMEDCLGAPFSRGDCVVTGRFNVFETCRAGLHDFPDNEYYKAYYMSFFERVLIEAYRKEIQDAAPGTPFIDRFPLDRVARRPNDLRGIYKILTMCLGTKIIYHLAPTGYNTRVYFPFIRKTGNTTYRGGFNMVTDNILPVSRVLSISAYPDSQELAFESWGDSDNETPSYILPRVITHQWEIG